MNYVPLHCRSEFSFNAGVPAIPALVRRAKELGIPALALTDTNRMSGLILFYLECKKHNITPILGVEITDPGNRTDTVVLLAKNAEGYGDICEIVTKRQLDSKRFSFEQTFSVPWPNLVFITGSPEPLQMLAQTPNRSELFAELVNNSHRTRRHSRNVEKIAQHLNIPTVISPDAYFLSPSDWETHRILRAVGEDSTLSRLREEEYAPRNAYLRSPDEIHRLFPNHAESLQRTIEIARRCIVTLDLGTWIMPKIEIPGGKTPEEQLRHDAARGLEKNYGGKSHYEAARRTQEMELNVIEKLGYASYFLIVKDIRDWANKRFAGGYRRPKDCTILRGSAANSITFYNLGVGDLDPIKYDLYFQRFLNEDRASPPDADLDFGWDERDEIFGYIADKWGHDRVAVTCTTNHYRRRAAFRETAKVLGYSEEQISALMHNQKSSVKRIDSEEIRNISRLAESIRGKPRFLGQHPGGLLITNKPICRHVALEYSGGEKNRIITQIDMHNGIDELGLIKFDFLGNGSLSVLRDTLAQLEQQNLPDPQVWDLQKCFNDPRVGEIIRTGRTRGVFYIESPAQTRLNTRARAETFEEITVTSSLIRPAGTAYCKMFVERNRKMKDGIKDWSFLHPSLEPILGETHDVCAFQEDVTKICRLVAGLSFKDADKIRKQMNCSHEGAVESKLWEQTARSFIKGCMSHSGLNHNQAVELWDRVASFSGFSFCKSHSAGYAQLSFKCSYLKAYYPAQFLAAVISNNHGYYSKSIYLDEARRWGIRILPMNINESHIKYWGKHTWMRPGLMHIRNLSIHSREQIIHERGHGRFHNLIDFIKRVRIGRKEVESLILVGAFDGFGQTRPELLYTLDGIYQTIQSEQPSFFQNEIVHRETTLHPGLTDYTHAQRCLDELHLLGYMLSGNILEILDLHPSARGAVSARDIPQFTGKRVKVFGWPITQRIHHTTLSGKPMLFITIEDKTECVDVILWPRIFEKFQDILAENGPYEIWGRVQEDWDTYAVVAESIKAVEWSPAQIDFSTVSQRLTDSLKAYPVYEDIHHASAA